MLIYILHLLLQLPELDHHRCRLMDLSLQVLGVQVLALRVRAVLFGQR